MKNIDIHILLIFIFTFILIGVIYYDLPKNENNTNNIINEENIDIVEEMKFARDNLKTNTSKTSIDLGLVLSGGPSKDGIPAINNPKFINIDSTKDEKGLNDLTLGISVEIGQEARFYPYSVLYWHEIVNDKMGGKNISVTFCPLCGTAIVYDRNIDGEEHNFGVSGKLYESNLLMYDNKTESLWSQSLGKALIGNYLGKELVLIESNVMNFGEFKDNYPNGEILSSDTGYSRNYGGSPYGSYETNDDIYFPVTNSDNRLDKKELLYVINYNGESYAFIRGKLIEAEKIELNIGDEKLVLIYDNGKIESKIGDEKIPGYVEMFFSWATGHPNNENLWGL